MMSFRIQAMIIVALAVLLLFILNMVRKRKLELKYVLAWILCDVILIIMTATPEIIDYAAEWLGIFDPMNMIFFLGFVFLIILVFILTVSISRATAKIRRMAQVLSIAEKRIEDLETTLKETGGKSVQE